MSAQTEIPTFLTCEGVPIQIWIEVAGRKIPHHAVEYDASKKEVSCWIQSEDDMPFVIKYKYKTNGYAMGMNVVLDGVGCGSYVLLPQANEVEYMLDCTRISSTEGREFRFGSLQLTDDDAYLDNLAKTPHFGEIRTIIDQKSKFEKSPITEYQRLISETSKVHEKSKKGLTHHVKHGEKKLMNPYSQYNTTSSGVLATFIFKYRPLEWLMASDIVSRDSIASSGASDLTKRKELEVKGEDSDEDIDSQEEDSADEEEKALLAQLEKVRQRKLQKEAEGSARKKIKLEPENQENHFMPGEIIDLTDETAPAKSLRRPVVPRKPAPVIDLT